MQNNTVFDFTSATRSQHMDARSYVQSWFVTPLYVKDQC